MGREFILIVRSATGFDKRHFIKIQNSTVETMIDNRNIQEDRRNVQTALRNRACKPTGYSAWISASSLPVFSLANVRVSISKKKTKNKEAVEVSIATEVLGGVLLDPIQSCCMYNAMVQRVMCLKPWRFVSHCGIAHCFKVISDSSHLRHDHA